uniref:Uncharacterized protein n=1 Tax=Rhizophora mucronata TaxID=61149 RepID=A0A2P2Q1N9_RHIMU
MTRAILGSSYLATLFQTRSGPSSASSPHEMGCRVPGPSSWILLSTLVGIHLTLP